jgi:hypothetical protein
MKILGKCARRALSWAAVAAGMLVSATSHALVVQIDSFIIDKGPDVVFADNFSSAGGSTPSQEPGAYSVFGAFPNGAESGGLLTLNTDWGGMTANAVGGARQALIATALTNINPANAPSGLTGAVTIEVAGTFNAVTPTGPLSNGYGVRVVDALFGSPSPTRIAQLQVAYTSGQAQIDYSLQDFVAGTITPLGSVAFAPGGADQIELVIGRRDPASNSFSAFYALGTGGAFGDLISLGGPAAMFVGTDFVRGQFFAATAVIPEPGTFTLFGMGAIAGFFMLRRRKQ